MAWSDNPETGDALNLTEYEEPNNGD